MNRAQACHYEPHGEGMRWTVAQIMDRKIAKKRIYPSKARFPVNQPKLRSTESVKLWKIVCMAFAPMTKTEWMDKARLHGTKERQLGASAISNLRKGHWVTCKNWLYQKREQ